MTIPFTDVAKQDLDWGDHGVVYLDDEINEKAYKEHCLARGLEYLYRVVTANTYAPRPKPTTCTSSSNHHRGIVKAQMPLPSPFFWLGQKEIN